MEINEPDVAHVNSAGEGSRSRNARPGERGGGARGGCGAGRTGRRGRSKKHRIACYRAGASKCSKYAPNARPRGPNRPMQITGRPPGRIRIINGLSRDRYAETAGTGVHISERTLIPLPGVVPFLPFSFFFSGRETLARGTRLCNNAKALNPRARARAQYVRHLP